MIVKAVLVGIKPLMMSTQAGADVTNPLCIENSRITKKKASSLTVEEQEALKWNKFLLNLHWSKEDGVVIPGINILKAIEEAARKDRKGKDVLRYVQMTQELYPLIYDGPQDKKALFDARGEDGKQLFVDTRVANHGTGGKISMVAETRPIFREWGLEVGFQFDTDEIEADDLERWIRRCGEFHGIGAYRTVYGRFTLTKFEEEKS